MKTIEELHQVAVDTLEKIKTELVETGRFLPQLCIVNDEGLTGFLFDPDGLNSAQFKTALFELVREEAKKCSADAVVFATDTWVLEYTPKQLRRQQEDPEYRKALNNIHSVREAARLGYGELWDAITVTVQSPLHQVLISQHYKLKPDEHAFSCWGKLDDFGYEGTLYEGTLSVRMMFFDAPQGVC